MLPAMKEVVLNRVTLRGPAQAIDSARAPLKTALEHSTWPATAPGELLFLRKISASGNPREIAARAAEQARRLADHAVDGWSTAAPEAMAVRFRNHTGLLACLIRDLLHGTAQHHWYWRRWHNVLQRPADEAIVTLLQDAPLHLPSVVAQLRTTTVWQSFWQTLGKTSAERLLTVAAQATGWSPTVQAARTLITSGGADAEPVTPLTGNTQPFDLAFLSTDGILTTNDPRPLLAALLTLWQQAPALLSQPAGAVQLHRLGGIIAGQRDATTPRQQPAKPDQSIPAPPADSHQNPAQPEQPAVTVESLSHSAPTPPVAMKKADNERNARIAPLSTALSTPEGVAQRERSPHLETTSQGTVTRIEEEQTAIITTETTSSQPLFEHNFITRQGGLFYLLNFLNLPKVQAQLPASQPGAGWRWLHDLATALGCPPEGELLDFLANGCSMENGTELAQQPPLATMYQLLRLGASRYGDEVWQPDTWQIPARMIASASHIDLHFRLNDACLAVRRVGLDINPGWLPWLGQVVTFHYGSGLEPER